jgi:hypothetical protein
MPERRPRLPNTVELVRITNPFRQEREVRQVAIVHSLQPLQAYVRDERGQIVTVLNGALIPPEKRDAVIPVPGDQIIVAHAIQGEFGRLLLSIAILVAALFVPALIGLEFATLGYAAVSAAIAIGGNLLLYAFTPKPQLAENEETPTYSWEGPANTVRQGTIIQRGYGTHIEGGQVIGRYLTAQGTRQWLNLLIAMGHGPARAIKNIKLNGNPLDNFRGVQVEKRMGFMEQTPISFFNDTRSDNPQSQKVRVDTGPVTVDGVRTDTQALEVEVTFPKGLWQQDDKGKLKTHTIWWKVQYKLHAEDPSAFKDALSPRTTTDVTGTPFWVAISQDQFSGGPNTIVALATDDDEGAHDEGDGFIDDIILPIHDDTGAFLRNETRTVRGTWTRNPAHPSNGGNQQGAQVVTVQTWNEITRKTSGSKTNPLRDVVRVDNLPPGQYDVRVTKIGSGAGESGSGGVWGTIVTIIGGIQKKDNDATTVGDEMWLTRITEIVYDDFKYPGMVLLGIRALATDQISGNISITSEVDWGDPETTGYKHSVAAWRPQAYYRFHETTGTVCNDSSGRGKHGTYVGAIGFSETSLVEQSPGKAARFGGGASVTTPDLPLGTDYCIEALLAADSFPQGPIADDGTNDGFRLLSNGKLSLYYSGAEHQSNTVLLAGQRYHVMLHVSGGNVSFVINGVKDANTFAGATALTVRRLLAGQNGVFDELAIYSPSIPLAVARLHYEMAISERNVLEDYTGDNPAIATHDALTNLWYGGAEPPARIDYPFLADWAEYANELVSDGDGGQIYRHTINAVFDSSQSLWDAVNKIAVLSRVAVMRQGLRYTGAIDRPDTPVQMFSVRNIKRGSYRKIWLGREDRANVVPIQYLNQFEAYQRQLMTVRDEDALAAGAEIVEAPTLDLFGATHPAQVWREAQMRLAQNRLLDALHEWESPVEAVRCTVGSLVKLQHDVPQWGLGGAIKSASGAQIVLDQQVTMEAGKNYQLSVVLPVVEVVSGTVAAVSGKRITLNGYAGQAIDRLVVGSVDAKVVKTGANYVDVDDPTGIVAAAAYVGYATDVIETRAVVNTENTTDSITVASGFTVDPPEYGNYIFGEVNNEARLVRVVTIRRHGELELTITALDYDADVYTAVDPVIPDPTTLSNERATVTGLEIVPHFRLEDGVYRVEARLTWKNGEDTAGVHIYAYRDEWIERPVQTLYGQSGATIEVTPGVPVKVRVIGFDRNGIWGPNDPSATVSFTPANITRNLLVNATFKGGFAVWSTRVRAGDLFTTSTNEDGYAEYEVAGSTYTDASKSLLQQYVLQGFAVGDYVMLSSYLEHPAGCTGTLRVLLTFLDAAGAQIGSVAAGNRTLSAGATNGLLRLDTNAVQVPANTVQVRAEIVLDNLNEAVSVPVGAKLRFNHLLLEVTTVGATEPSVWADLDSNGLIESIFIAGGSSGMEGQGSMLPTFSGSFTYTSTTTTLTPAWTNLQVRWPRGAITLLQDGSRAITGLNPSTTYYGYPRYNVKEGNVNFVPGGVGTPAEVHTAKTSALAAAQHADGFVPLSAGAVQMATTAAGSGGGTVGGDGCPRAGMKVESRTRGVINAEDVQVGEELRAAQGEWLSWFKVTAVKREPCEVFVRLTLEDGEYIDVSPETPVPLFFPPGQQPKAADVGLASVLFTREGAAMLRSVEVVRGDFQKVIISGNPPHTYLCGAREPKILTHNTIIQK